MLKLLFKARGHKRETVYLPVGVCQRYADLLPMVFKGEYLLNTLHRRYFSCPESPRFYYGAKPGNRKVSGKGVLFRIEAYYFAPPYGRALGP